MLSNKALIAGTKYFKLLLDYSFCGKSNNKTLQLLSISILYLLTLDVWIHSLSMGLPVGFGNSHDDIFGVLDE